jgi:hypothetical protein
MTRDSESLSGQVDENRVLATFAEHSGEDHSAIGGKGMTGDWPKNSVV